MDRQGPRGIQGNQGNQGFRGFPGTRLSTLVKILIPAGIALATAVGGTAYTRALGNEHRLTSVEDSTTFQNQKLWELSNRQGQMDDKLDHVTEALGRIEGTLGTKPGS